MPDVRNPNPDATLHGSRFKIGWADATSGTVYTDRTLKSLKWQNLGWRLGALLGPTSEELIEEQYQWCVRQQAEGGTLVGDD